jgi:hypothetical protein
MKNIRYKKSRKYIKHRKNRTVKKNKHYSSRRRQYKSEHSKKIGGNVSKKIAENLIKALRTAPTRVTPNAAILRAVPTAPSSGKAAAAVVAAAATATAASNAERVAVRPAINIGKQTIDQIIKNAMTDSSISEYVNSSVIPEAANVVNEIANSEIANSIKSILSNATSKGEQEITEIISEAIEGKIDTSDIIGRLTRYTGQEIRDTKIKDKANEEKDKLLNPILNKAGRSLSDILRSNESKKQLTDEERYMLKTNNILNKTFFPLGSYPG